jgi:SAM-dependent methyltransferase
MRTDDLRRFCPPVLRAAARSLNGRVAQLRARMGVGDDQLHPGEPSRDEPSPRSRSRLFSEIYQRNWWGGVSLSGSGSGLEQTVVIRAEIPRLLAEIGARSILDAPCGDLYWMKECRLDVAHYIGMDIVPGLIDKIAQERAAPGRRFIVGDIVSDALPQVDLIFCRDCLVHLSTREILRATQNMQRSGSAFLLTTTFPGVRVNEKLNQKVRWRPLNLTRPPFDFPPPLRVLNEGCTEDQGRWADKSLGLWRLADLGAAADRLP